MVHERRKHAGRIPFPVPRPATFGAHKVVLIDLGCRGAGIRHEQRILPGTTAKLSFRFERTQHEVPCQLRRSRLLLDDAGESRSRVYHSGLEFTDIPGSIRNAIQKRIDRVLRRQHADAFGDPSYVEMEESSDSFSTEALAAMMQRKPYLRCSYERGRWKREGAEDAAQPDNGFTILVDEDPHEVDLLCQTWEAADREQRKLIRLFATLALQEPSEVPRSRFRP